MISTRFIYLRSPETSFESAEAVERGEAIRGVQLELGQLKQEAESQLQLAAMPLPEAETNLLRSQTPLNERLNEIQRQRESEKVAPPVGDKLPENKPVLRVPGLSPENEE